MNHYIAAGLIFLAIVFFWWLVLRDIRRQAAKMEATVLSARETRAKIGLNSEFVCRIRHAATVEELSVLGDEIRSRENDLFGDDFANLLERMKARSRELQA